MNCLCCEQREAFRPKAEPAGVAVETSGGASWKEDVQSSSASFQDSEKV